MRILHVVESTGGGVLSVVIQMCEILVDEGHEVYVIFSRRPETPQNLEKLFHPQVHLMEMKMVRNISPFKDFISLMKLFQKFSRIKPEIVHLHSSKAGFLGRVASFFYNLLRKKKMRVFYSPHSFSFFMQHSKINNRIFVLLEKFANACGGIIIACSNTEAQAAKNVLKARKVRLLENATSVPDLKKPENGGTVIVATLGRITDQKNPLMFLELAASFQMYDNLLFKWIGGGNTEYIKLFKDHSNVELTGWLDRNDAIKELAIADVYVQLSKYEGMPIAVIEAMQLGKPVIVTNVPGNKDVVKHGVTGFIINNRTELEHRLKEILSDHKLRKTMGLAAQKEAKTRFGMSRFRRELLQLYNESI